jgi:hypothetical protein
MLPKFIPNAREAYCSGILLPSTSEAYVIFVVTYDLKTPHDTETDYQRVIAAIKSYETWCHLEKSVWLIRTDVSAAEIRDFLKNSLYSTDVLFVGRLNGNWASFNVGQQRSNWLKQQTF